MEASPARLPDGTWGIRIWDPDGDATTWTGQGVTVKTRQGKTWTAEVGALVSAHESGKSAVYEDARKARKAAEAESNLRPVEPEAAQRDIAPQRAPRDDDGHLAEIREALEDRIGPARRTIVAALKVLQHETDLSDDEYLEALDVFDRLAGTEGEPPFERLADQDVDPLAYWGVAA